MPTKISDYKGNPIISCALDDADKHPHTFGLGKARRILANIEDIKKFVAENESKKSSTTE
jgi:hypothetical protein